MFDDIRPYHDDEVNMVLRQLNKEKELHNSVASLSSPLLLKIFPWLARLLVKWSLKFRIKHIHQIKDIQTEIAKYLPRTPRKVCQKC